MHPLNYIFLVFGSILAVVGIVFFMKMGTQGESSIRMFGFEFKLGGSSLVIFVLGVVLFLVPVIHPIPYHGSEGNSYPPKQRPNPSPAPRPASTPDSQSSRSYTGLKTIAALIKEIKNPTLASSIPNSDPELLELVVREAICRIGSYQACQESEGANSVYELETIAKKYTLLNVEIPIDLQP